MYVEVTKTCLLNLSFKTNPSFGITTSNCSKTLESSSISSATLLLCIYNLKKGCSASGVRSGALFKIGKCSWPLFTFLHFRQVMKHDDNVRNPRMQYPIIAILESLFIFHLLLLNVPDGDISSFCLLYIRECVLY